MRNVGFCKELNVSLNSFLIWLLQFELPVAFPLLKPVLLKQNATIGVGGGHPRRVPLITSHLPSSNKFKVRSGRLCGELGGLCGRGAGARRADPVCVCLGIVGEATV